MSTSYGYEVGSRVRDVDGFRATVRYIGPVVAAKDKLETWLGVEWDKPDRGKHDGSCVDSVTGQLHRYFICSNPSAGSFIKPNKLLPFKTFLEALKDKYVEIDAPEITGPDSKIPDAFVMTSKGNQKSIEFVGEMKIRKWQQLDVVDKVAIRNDSISSIGNDPIFELAGHFCEIDLQDNLIYKWSEVELLTSQISNLSTLLLHGNKFEAMTEDVFASLNSNNFAALRVLALNSCNIKSWAEVQRIGHLVPSLEELYLANNCIIDMPSHALPSHSTGVFNFSPSSALTGAVEGFQHVRVLDLSSCQIAAWSQVLALEGSSTAFSSLQELILDGNPIDSITPYPDTSVLMKLQRISLSSTKLASWSDIDALSSYPSIQQLRLSHITLFNGKGASEVRPKVIARMKSLILFNGSGISSRERLDAEKNYLRGVVREISDAQEAHPDMSPGDIIDTIIASQHPRYKELHSLYAHDLAPVGRVNEGLTLAADMINVTFKNMSTKGTFDPVPKKIPSSVTISRLKMMVRQLFGLETKLQQLSLRIYKDAPPTFLDDDQSNLQYYGAIDGAEIFINESKA